jgi:hypothetical protein
MRIRNTCLLLSALLFAGCWQKSLHPFYTNNDLTTDSKLVGTWTDAEQKDSDSDRTTWTFSDVGNKQYLLVLSNKEGVYKFTTRLFDLGGKRFMDMAPAEEVVAAVPAHHLFQVPDIAPDVKLAALDLDWMTKWLQAHPNSIAFLRVPGLSDKDKEELVLTADTKALQTFVKQHMADEGFFREPTVLKKVKGEK